jgi:hypothetical protein
MIEPQQSLSYNWVFERRTIGMNLIALLCLNVFLLIAAPAAARVTDMPDRARVDAIAAMLPDQPAGSGPVCADKAAWSSARTHPGVAELLRDAQAKLHEPLPAWSDDAYLEFSRNGQRPPGERMQYQRKVFLYPLVMAACIDDDPAMLAKVEEVLLALIAEPSWLFPAHDRKLSNFHGQAYDVDLLAADFAHDLAQTLHMLKGRLSARTVAAVTAAVEERVFAPMRATFRTGTGNSWLSIDNNWNAVCLKGVTGAALAMLPDGKDRALFVAAAEHFITNYLESFTADGYSLEGPSYWNYGFSHFVELRQLMLKATGSIDLFVQHPRALDVALYGYRFPMHQGNIALFGDAGFWRPDPFTLMVGNEAFGLGQKETRANTRLGTRPPHNSAPIAQAALVLGEPIIPVSGSLPAGDTRIDPLRWHFASVGVFVSRSTVDTPTALSVTIKADGNQHHSHNDIGSYTIGVADAQPVGDPGKTEYSAKSFGPDRYAIRANNSYGHSLPLVAGQLQLNATRVSVVLPMIATTPEQEIYILDLRPAYSVGGLLHLQRSMRHARRANAVELRDDFRFDVPKTFETAITTLGQAERLDDTRWRFTHKGKSILATISASSPFDLSLEKIDEEGLVFHRLAVKLKEPQREGQILIVYSGN